MGGVTLMGGLMGVASPNQTDWSSIIVVRCVSAAFTATLDP